MRLAYLSPLPPARSGIADYSAELLPDLARLAEVDLFVPDAAEVEAALAGRYPVHDCRDLAAWRHANPDAIPLYHMGNSPYHEFVYEALSCWPGVTVLHDYYLHHFIVEATVARGHPAEYLHELLYAHGPRGAVAGRAALRPFACFPYFDYPLNRRVLDCSLGVIVFNDWTREHVLRQVPGARVQRIEQHVVVPRPLDLLAVRSVLGLDAEALIIGSFGLVTPEKRIDVALRAFARLRQTRPELARSRYLVVGEIAPTVDLGALISELGLAGAVDVRGRVDFADFERLIAATDICMALRWPSLGETSASTLRLLAAGRAVIVSDAGPLGELPDEICLKVPSGDQAEEALVAALGRLAAAPNERCRLGEAAREYVGRVHSLERSAAQYSRAITSLLSD